VILLLYCKTTISIGLSTDIQKIFSKKQSNKESTFKGIDTKKIDSIRKTPKGYRVILTPEAISFISTNHPMLNTVKNNIETAPSINLYNFKPTQLYQDSEGNIFKSSNNKILYLDLNHINSFTDIDEPDSILIPIKDDKFLVLDGDSNLIKKLQEKNMPYVTNTITNLKTLEEFIAIIFHIASNNLNNNPNKQIIIPFDKNIDKIKSLSPKDNIDTFWSSDKTKPSIRLWFIFTKDNTDVTEIEDNIASSASNMLFLLCIGVSLKLVIERFTDKITLADTSNFIIPIGILWQIGNLKIGFGMIIDTEYIILMLLNAKNYFYEISDIFRVISFKIAIQVSNIIVFIAYNYGENSISVYMIYTIPIFTQSIKNNTANKDIITI